MRPIAYLLSNGDLVDENGTVMFHARTIVSGDTCSVCLLEVELGGGVYVWEGELNIAHEECVEVVES